MSSDGRNTQEPDVVPTRSILVVGAVCIAVGVAAVLIGGLPARRMPPAPVPAAPAAEEQRLLDGPARGLEVQAAQREELNHYGWVDRDAGVARIPIDKAMDIVVDESP